ncbi:ninjurin-A-like isoform X1 [Homalodisca vitripennis]|uniref:ninjurin-A-like isoform X1 n=1 Tax=Homalodisca vitripennis TaxID=197043 RepID=UPI001EEB45D2|nr:ninjurin-A-like isoform X1 [Homalodisca vitripennis]
MHKRIMEPMDMDTTVVKPSTTQQPLTLQNTYAAKKTIAQGMMDFALVMANANQMRLIFEHQATTKSSTFLIVLISISLGLQIVVGISLIFKGRCDLGGDSKLEQANRINNWVLVGVFLITIINVFITAFTSTAAPPVTGQ